MVQLRPLDGIAHLPMGIHLDSPESLKEFKRENACPSTGLLSGACQGYEVDHIDPLCMGEPDTKENMQWLSVEDHRFKTFTDVRACRKLKEAASQPAQKGGLTR